MSDSREHIDKLWNRALQESVVAGEEFTRYRFAAMIEAETARRCAELIEGQGAIGGHRSVMADAIRAAFPEASE